VAASLATAAESKLEEFTVTSHQLEESTPLTLQRYGNQLNIVQSDDILKHGFVDVTDSLKTLVPGLHISPKNGPFDYFKASLQGSRNQDILWLVDGVRITNRLYNGTSPLDTIPAHMVERVEVLKGGQGIFYGTQAVGGVINIVTKAFSNSSAGAVGTGVNSNDGYNLNAFARGAAGEHQYVVYLSKNKADGYVPYAVEDIQPSATDVERGYDVNTAGLKYAWNISDQNRLSAQYQISDADLDYTRPYLNKNTVNARRETLMTLKLDSQLSESLALFAKAYRHTWDTDYSRVYNELDGSGELTGGSDVRDVDTYWGYEDYGLNVLMEYSPGGRFEYVLGLDNQNFSGQDDVWRIADQREKVNAVFAQLRTSEALFDNTLLALGVRNNRPSNSESATVWNLSGKHDFNSSWYLQGNVGTAFRLPDAEALFLNEYYDDNGDGVPDGGWFAIGNPDLKAEESRNLNLSLGGVFGRLSFELTGFKRDITNYIDSYVAVTIGGVVGETFVNSDDEVNIEGLELVTRMPLADSLKVQLSLTETRARFNDQGEQLKDIPERELKLGLSYQQPGSPWGGALTANYVGDINDRETRESYTVTDLSGFYFLGAGQQHRVTLRLENITDKHYATRIDKGTEDKTGSAYLYRNLGVGRTLHLAYNYQF